MSNFDTIQHEDPFYKNSLSLKSWNALLTESHNLPMFGKVFDSQIDKITKVRHVKGSTYFMNCYETESFGKSSHKSKLMQKLGLLYELARTYDMNSNKLDGSHMLFTEALKLPFSQLFMHQCEDHFDDSWDTEVLQIVFNELKEAKLLIPTYDIPLHHSYDASTEASHFLCFDDVYMSYRNKAWLQGRQHQKAFRLNTMAALQNQQLMAEMILETRSDIDTASEIIRQSYCAQENTHISNARIVIIQSSSANFYDGNFVNLNEVVNVVQSFTSIPVSISILNTSSTFMEQVSLFNSYDIYITPSGDHLINGMFSINSRSKGLIEVVPFLSDNTSFYNYHYELGFADYIVSSGHLTPVGSNEHCPFKTESEYSNRHCFLHKEPILDHKIRQSILLCDEEMKITSDCRLSVNTNFLKRHVDILFKKVLCPHNVSQSLTSTLNHSIDIDRINREKDIANNNEALLNVVRIMNITKSPLLWISSVTDFETHFNNMKRMWAVAASFGRSISVVAYTYSNETLRICDFFTLPKSIKCSTQSRIEVLKSNACTRLDMDGFSPSFVYQPSIYQLPGEFNIAGLPTVNWHSSVCVVGIPVTKQFMG